MPYLDIFCFVCSIRLGSISTGILSIVSRGFSSPFQPGELCFLIHFQIQITVPMVFLVIEGSDVLKDFAEKLENYFENTDVDTDFLMLMKYLQERK